MLVRCEPEFDEHYDGVDGEICEPDVAVWRRARLDALNCVQHMSELLKTVVKHPFDAATYGQRAYERISSHFSNEHVREQVIERFRILVVRRGERRSEPPHASLAETTETSQRSTITLSSSSTTKRQIDCQKIKLVCTFKNTPALVLARTHTKMKVNVHVNSVKIDKDVPTRKIVFFCFECSCVVNSNLVQIAVCGVSVTRNTGFCLAFFFV